MDRLLNVLTVICLAMIVLVLRSVRRAHIRVEYSVVWLAASVALLVLSRWPGLLEYLARQLGISYPPLTVVLIGGVIFLLIFYRYSVIISGLKDDNIALAQRVAILEYRLETVEKGKSS